MTASAGGSPPIGLFISYSHKDEALREQLGTHLSLLKRQGVIDEWHDRRIGAVQEWAGAIDEHLNRADVILLLVSADFLTSDYCYDLEMTRALERHDAGDARVIPVILRPVDWRGAPFAKLQALPKDAKPVISWRDRNQAFTEVALGISLVASNFKTTRASGHNRLHHRPLDGTVHRRTTREFDVFLSHSHNDARDVERLACVLEDNHKFRVWLDKWILPPGKLWQQEIAKALTLVGTCVVCIGFTTPRGWFQQEIQRALNIQNKKEGFSVIPLILPGGNKDLIDDFLELRTWVDFSKDLESPEAMHLLVCGIKKIPPGRFVSESAAAHRRNTVLADLRELAEFRKERVIDEDVHKRIQIRILEKHLNIEGDGDVSI